MNRQKKDADYVFYELTRSICPNCRKVIDAKVLLRDNKVYMRKRCPDCGPFEALVYADAEAYTSDSNGPQSGQRFRMYTLLSRSSTFASIILRQFGQMLRVSS